MTSVELRIKRYDELFLVLNYQRKEEKGNLPSCALTALRILLRPDFQYPLSPKLTACEYTLELMVMK